MKQDIVDLRSSLRWCYNACSYMSRVMSAAGIAPIVCNANFHGFTTDLCSSLNQCANSQ